MLKNRVIKSIVFSLLWHSCFILANNLLVLGDSLSTGYGLAAKEGWVFLLQKKLKTNNYPYEVINASINGDTTQNGLDRLPELLEKYHPDIVIIALGGNDGLRGLKLEQMKKNLNNIVRLCKNKKARVLLVGVTVLPNYGRKYTIRFEEVYQQVAKQNQVSLVPNLFSVFKSNTKFLQEDGIHLTVKAQPLLLNLIWPKLLLLLNKDKT